LGSARAGASGNAARRLVIFEETINKEGRTGLAVREERRKPALMPSWVGDEVSKEFSPFLYIFMRGVKPGPAGWEGEEGCTARKGRKEFFYAPMSVVPPKGDPSEKLGT